MANTRLFATGLLMGLLMGLITCPVRADTVVVVGAQSAIASLSREQVADIFLGRNDAYPNGQQARPVEQFDSTPEHAEFHAGVTGKNKIQLKAYWSKLVFAGRATPPPALNQDDILKLLASQPGVIAYVDRSKVSPALRIVYAH